MSAARVLAPLGACTMEPNPMVAKPSRRRRRATTGDLSAIFEEAKIGSYDAGDASADVKPRRQLSVKAEPGPRRSASLGPSQFAEPAKPRVRRATFDSFGAPGNSFGAADSPRRSLSQRPEGTGRAADGEPPKRTSSRRSSNHRAPSHELRRSNSFDIVEGRRGKNKPREKLGAVEEEEVVALKPNGGRPRRRRATTGDLGCSGAAHDAASGGNGDDEARDNETAKMQAVISALQVLHLKWPRLSCGHTLSMEHAAGQSVSRTHLPTPTLQGEAASLPRFSELVRRGRQAEERMKLWEQAQMQLQIG